MLNCFDSDPQAPSPVLQPLELPLGVLEGAL